jgi:ribosomal protein S18 acetylase RimI-like enzyme
MHILEAPPSDIGFQVVEAKAEDAQQMASLFRRVWREFEDRLPAGLLDARRPTTEEVKEWIEQDPFFIVKIAGRVVGIVGCSLEGDSCQLKRMVVDSQYRRQGIGSALTKRVIEYAKQHQARKVWLDTLPVLKEAIAMYRKHGFVSSGYLRGALWGADVELYELVLP